MKIKVTEHVPDSLICVYGLPVNLNHTYSINMTFSGEEYKEFLELIHGYQQGYCGTIRDKIIIERQEPNLQ